ncbi:hypothetical protein MNBD_BACTEROID01-2852 [hydrothermal vent metagenome]|uniref:Uncharacterized protein n=1 Tax=hydrothermal vent metagenome TaxID=652676 RepID=A0A3B0TND0_9ZZZZ
MPKVVFDVISFISMQITEDKERLISRYLNSSCNAYEQKHLLEWINQSKENKKHYLT